MIAFEIAFMIAFEIGVLLNQHHPMMIEGFVGLGAFPVLEKHTFLH